jgi:hypothetical protein
MSVTTSRRSSRWRRVARNANRVLNRWGLEVRRRGHPAPEPPDAQRFRAAAKSIEARHRAQTAETVRELRKKYAAPLFGRVRVWELVERLSQCIDPTDYRLYCANQQVHVLQVLEGMERDGVDTPDLVLAALVHDLGKVLLLTNEDPANIACMNTPIGSFEEGVGLEQCVFQWNHDELAYSRLKDHVPEHIAWLVRYHSLYLPTCKPLMDERDKGYFARYLGVFEQYDRGTKSPFRLPQRRIDEYRHVIEAAFPEPILF